MEPDIPERQIIRPKFVGGLIAPFLLLTILSSLAPPSNLLNTVGVLVPFSWMMVRCFQTDQPDFGGLVSVKEARWIWLPSLTVGLLAYRFIGTGASIAWFISAGTFVLYEPLIYNTLVGIGFIVPREGKGYKGFD